MATSIAGHSKSALRAAGAAFLFSVVAAAQTTFLPIENPVFASDPVQCSVGYAYQSADGGTCSSYAPQQAFNGQAGFGWTFSVDFTTGFRTGLTSPAGTNFEPPSFTGLPFTQAVFLEGAHTGVSQTLSGLSANTIYRLSFYLGSRYATGVFNGRPYDGNQTVAATIDNQVIGSWSLFGYTPFTLQTRLFEVASSGPHVLKFSGLSAGDHTAFLSGVSIEIASK